MIQACVLILVSCSTKENLNCYEATPNPRALDIVEGKIFVLEITDPKNSYSRGEKINLKVENISNHQIWFPNHFNLLIMHRASGNSTTFLPAEVINNSTEPIILDTDEFKFHYFSFVPKVPPLSEPIDLEIFVSGYIYSDGKICTGRYRASVIIEVQP